MTARGARPPGSEFIARIRRTCTDRGLLSGGEHVVLAVSGGPDSLAMLYAFAELAGGLDLRLHVAHFDHRLRAGSDSDGRFVQRHARALGIPCSLGVADDTAPLPKQSPEESARSRRYGFIHGVAREIGATRIATAHTLDDQAETVLMRLLVGAGRRGLSGIPPRRWYTIRPLIDVRRADVEAFCRARRLRPRIDPSNADPAFLRNVLRNEIIPVLLDRVNARLPESLHRLSDIVRDEDAFLDAEAALRASVEGGEGEGSRLKLDALRAMPVALQRRAIRLLARNEGPGIDHANTEAVRRLALGSPSGAELHLPGPLSARVEYGFLVVGRMSSPTAPASVTLVVPGETDLPPWSVAVRSWTTAEHPVRWPDGRTGCVLDADLVRLPLCVRRWRPGDRIRPLGMSREKKLSDVFTDAKVPRAARAATPVLADHDGRIVWLVGHRIDDRVKVTDKTRRFLWLAIEGGTT